MGKAIDITGQRFGMLTALYPLEKKAENGSVLWVCSCSCSADKIHVAKTKDLRFGSVLSCGCERDKNRFKPKDITGDVFGRLTVIGPT